MYMINLIIPIKDKHEYTDNFIKSLYVSDWELDCVKIILIDNSDEEYYCSSAVFRSRIKTIRNQPSKSVTTSWNQGLRHCFDDTKCQYIGVVNNDILCGGSILPILVAQNNHYGGFIGPRVVDPPVDVGLMKTRFCTKLHESLNRHKPVEFQQHLTGSFFFAARCFFEQVGLFDEQFILHYQESDYFERIKLLNLPSWQSSLVYIYHFGSQTTKSEYKDNKISLEDLNRYNRKWPGAFNNVAPNMSLHEVRQAMEGNINGYRS